VNESEVKLIGGLGGRAYMRQNGRSDLRMGLIGERKKFRGNVEALMVNYDAPKILFIFTP
jgi:hypothetical protein